MPGEFAPQMLQRTASDVSDIPGGTLFIPCDGFSGLSVDDIAEQDLTL